MASSYYIHLDRVRLQIDRYVLPIILVLGNVTNLANIYVFFRRNLRTYACSWYFMCLSIAHLLLLDSLGIPRAATAWSSYDYTSYNLAYCKGRAYLFTLSMLLSRQFICLISIDRWVVTSSSAWLRSQSSLRVARLVIVISVLCWCLYDVHALVGYQANGFGCYPPPFTAYASFAAVDTIVTTLLPLVNLFFHSSKRFYERSNR